MARWLRDRLHAKCQLRLLISFAVVTLIFILIALILIGKEDDSLRFQHDVLEAELILQSARHKLINRVCSEIEPSKRRVDNGTDETSDEGLESLSEVINFMDHFIVDDAHKLIYCFVPKVASTNWKRVLLALGSRLTKGRPHTDPLHISANESQVQNLFETLNKNRNLSEVFHKLRTYMKFTFVRHPYERLLSAYRNKFEIAWSDYFRQRFGRKIVKSYRHNASQESLDKGHDVTFPEFLTYVLELNRSDHKSSFNEHWRPINDLCFPCRFEFDVIGKYETLVDDADLVLWKSKVFDFVRFPRRDQTYNSVPSAHLLKKYFSQIDPEIMAKLAKLYKEDFALFGYSDSLTTT